MRTCDCSGYFKASVVFLVAVFILQSIGLGTDHWVKYVARNYEIHSGLWRSCVCYYSVLSYYDKRCNCQYFTGSIQGWLSGVRVFEWLGIICLILAGIVLCVQQTISQHMAAIKTLAILLTLTSGASILIGVSVFASNMVRKFHYSFIFCTIAGVLSLVCSIILFKDRNRQSSANSNLNIERNIESIRVRQEETHIPPTDEETRVQQIVSNSRHARLESEELNISSSNHSQNTSDLPPSYDEIVHEMPPPSYNDVMTQQNVISDY